MTHISESVEALLWGNLTPENGETVMYFTDQCQGLEKEPKESHVMENAAEYGTDAQNDNVVIKYKTIDVTWMDEHMNELLTELADGTEFIVKIDNQPVARIMPVTSPSLRTPGLENYIRN